MKNVLTLAASAVMVVALCGAEPADNWPAWRGPTADGVAPAGANPPRTWDANTNIKWKAPLTGKGSATPIVWGNRVFVLTAIKTERMAKAEELPQPDPRFKLIPEAPYTLAARLGLEAGGRKIGAGAGSAIQPAGASSVHPRNYRAARQRSADHRHRRAAH